jgi:DNA-binding IclR family transcriptional regulator
MRDPGGEGAPSVADRVFVVLECCAASNRPLTLVDLVDRTGLPKTTLHRVCWKLVKLGMLEHSDLGFEIGTKLFALGGMNPLLRRLRVAAMPLMHTLVQRTGMATNLAVLADDRALIVEEVYGRQTPPMRRMVGGGLPLTATAVGKALLAGLTEAEVDARLDVAVLRPYTRSTVVRPNLLRDQIAQIRTSGVAFSHEEWSVGASGVAAPVLVHGDLVCALAIVGTLTPTQLRQYAAPVRGTATWLARALESSYLRVTPARRPAAA